MEPWVERNAKLKEFFLKAHKNGFTERKSWEFDYDSDDIDN